MQLLMEQGIDAYVADTQFRKRDPRFAERTAIRSASEKSMPRPWYDDCLYDTLFYHERG